VRSPREQRRATQRGEPVILFRVGESTFAIAATAVDEIRNAQGLKPLRTAPDLTNSKVRYSLLRDGKFYFVVDATVHFKMLPARATRVLVLRNTKTAVLVGDIDRMTEVCGVHPLPNAFRGAERNWYRGLALLGAQPKHEVVPIVNPGAFLTKVEMQALGDAISTTELNS